MRALFNYYNITEPHTTSKQVILVILVILPISILSLVIATPSHPTSYLSSSFVTNFTKFVPALKAEGRPADSQVAGDDHTGAVVGGSGGNAFAVPTGAPPGGLI